MLTAAAPPAAPHDEEPVSSSHGLSPKTARRRTRRAGAITILALSVAVVAALFSYLHNHRQDSEINANAQRLAIATHQLNGVLDQQNMIIGQVCRIAGGQVNRNATAANACRRVAAGKPAVPTPSPAIAPISAPGIDFVTQDGPCYLDIVLTNHVVNRLGPLCGAAGASGQPGVSGSAGATGVPGVTGQPGEIGQPGATGQPGDAGATGIPGADGVGITDVSTSADRCFVTVSLSDGSTRSLGPFCGAPATAITLTLSDGSVQACSRSGGDDANPAYSCSAVPPPTTEPTS